MARLLEGKVAIVTGGSLWIGCAVAVMFAREIPQGKPVTKILRSNTHGQ